MVGQPGKFLLLFVSLALVSACDLPRGAAEQRQVLRGADSPDSDFAVQTVARGTLATLSAWPTTGRSAGVDGWITHSRAPSGLLIEAGDAIDLAVWDNEASSLLMQPQQKVVALKGMTVSPKGTVFLPYLDEVYIAKMTPDEARRTIQEKMVSIIPSAQVQLSHVSGRKSSVDLVSGVRKPGNVPMPDRDFTVMSLIAQGGGIDDSLKNPQIRLVRDGKLYGVSMDKLLKNPSLDTTLRGGDKVYVEDDERYFLALGAADKEAQVPFPSDRVTALDAVSLVGGINDQRGDPKGVLILRNYRPEDVRPDGVSGPPKDRMIFAVDLTTADGLFSAGEFQIHDRDLVMVSESPLSAANTMANLLYTIAGVGQRANGF